MALGSTQPLVKMSTRDVPGGNGGLCVRLKTYHHIVPMSRNLGALTLLDPCGPAWPVMGVLYLLPTTSKYRHHNPDILHSQRTVNPRCHMPSPAFMFRKKQIIS
jgi:hypothetical protein